MRSSLGRLASIRTAPMSSTSKSARLTWAWGFLRKFTRLSLSGSPKMISSPARRRQMRRCRKLPSALAANSSASSPSTNAAMEQDLLYWLLAMLLVAIGLAGVVLPAIPGAPLIFAGLFVAAWVDDFAYVGTGPMVILGLLACVPKGVHFCAAMFGGKRFGASKRAIVGALVGTIVGLFLGLPGVLFGPFIGAVIGELSAQRSLEDAAGAGFGATIGLVLGVALKVALALSMIGIFLVAPFFFQP